jgi:hypothetical protein
VILTQRHAAANSPHHASAAYALFAIRRGPQASPAQGLEQGLAALVLQAVDAPAPTNDHLLRSDLRLGVRRCYAVQLCGCVRGEVTLYAGYDCMKPRPANQHCC